MKSKIISDNIAEFIVTKNPIYIIDALILIFTQGRVCEVLYSIYCKSFFSPSPVKATQQQLKPILESFTPMLLSKDFLSRENLIGLFNNKFSINQLPNNFIGSRIETTICNQKYLIIGEYGKPGKRIAFITEDSCEIIEFYENNPSVRHIHSIYPTRDAKKILITTGDNAKYLDLWTLKNDTFNFDKRLKSSLAGYTAILDMGGEYYMGTDFSQRPNYIETLNGRKYFFPKKAWSMAAIKFHQYQNRFIISLNRELSVFGGRHTISVFDCKIKEYVYCDYQDYKEPFELNKILHRSVISLRSGGTTIE